MARTKVGSQIASWIAIPAINLIMIFFVIHVIEPNVDMTQNLAIILMCITIGALILFAALRTFRKDIKKKLKKIKI